MNPHSTVWLQVCLYLSLSIGLATNLSAAAAAGDVLVTVRNADGVDQKLNASAFAQTDIEILERARVANDDIYSSLQSFVCKEEMNRFKGKLDGQSAHALDTVTAKLSFEQGTEQYSDVHQNQRPKPGMSSLPGAWSEGEFGTLLLQTKRLLESKHITFEAFADLKSERTAIYQFDVTAEESPWDLSVAGSHYRIPFRTEVWISVNTGEILKIDRTTLSIPSPTHLSEIEWSVTLDHIALNGIPWLLPSTGTYAVLYNESRHREWNLISFTDYQRYGAQTALKFE